MLIRTPTVKGALTVPIRATLQRIGLISVTLTGMTMTTTPMGIAVVTRMPLFLTTWLATKWVTCLAWLTLLVLAPMGKTVWLNPWAVRDSAPSLATTKVTSTAGTRVDGLKWSTNKGRAKDVGRS